jgi:hypothetical protein
MVASSSESRSLERRACASRGEAEEDIVELCGEGDGLGEPGTTPGQPDSDFARARPVKSSMRPSVSRQPVHSPNLQATMSVASDVLSGPAASYRR